MRATSRMFLLAATFPSLLAAQGVIVQSNADVRLFGALGSIANMAMKMGGGDMHNMPSTTYIAGHKMKVESSNNATILDADAGRVTTIDMKQKSYTSMTFAEMAAAMQQAKQSAQQQMKTDQSKAAAKDPNAPQGDMNVKYTVAVDRPSQHDKVAGYDAERVFITITLEGEATPQGEKTEQVGSMVLLMDQWMSKDAPQIAATQDFQRAYAAKAGEAFRAQTEGLQAAFASDPRIKDGFTAAAKELAKVPGISLRSVTYVALVPATMTFDRKLVLGDAVAQAAPADSAAKKDDKPKSGGLRGMFGALKSAAEDASKKSDKSSGSQPPPPQQATVMSVTTQVTSITTGGVPAGTFDIPAGFREIKMKAPPAI